MTIEVTVDKLHPGCTTSRPIKPHGEVLFPEDYELKNEDILWLKLWRVKTVSIQEQSLIPERIPA